MTLQQPDFAVSACGQPLLALARLLAVLVPVTFVALVLCVIWIIGVVVPATHANAHATARQAGQVLRVLALGRP